MEHAAGIVNQSLSATLPRGFTTRARPRDEASSPPSRTTMGKDTPRREANRVGRGGNGMKKKAIANLTTKKKTIVKAPREVRDIRIKKKGDASSMDVADGSASAGGKKSKPGKNLRKAQRKLSGSKKATRAKKEKRKHVN